MRNASKRSAEFWLSALEPGMKALARELNVPYIRREFTVDEMGLLDRDEKKFYQSLKSRVSALGAQAQKEERNA